jgi:hypothetical protein
MAELKTKETNASVADFLNGIADEKIREDCRKIAGLMQKAADAEPRMWGDSIVGFGSRTMQYSTGREVDWLEIGFAPRKANLTLYLAVGEGFDEDLLGKLGKHKTGKGCLYFKRLSDVDEEVLEKIIVKSVENIRKQK